MCAIALVREHYITRDYRSHLVAYVIQQLLEKISPKSHWKGDTTYRVKIRLIGASHDGIQEHLADIYGVIRYYFSSHGQAHSCIK